MVPGTPLYATKSDVWALGITAYALLFGEFPYSVDDVIKGKGHPYPSGVTCVPLPGDDKVQNFPGNF